MIRALVHELSALLVGSRVQRALQPDSATVQLEVYPAREGRGFLSISASATRPYFVLLGEKLDQPPAPLRFCQLLRSRLENGGIEAVEQVGTDRVVRVIVRRREDGVDHRYALVAELFGPRADVYLFDLDDGKALGKLKNGPMPESLAVAAERPSAFEMDATALRPFLERMEPGALFRELDAVPPGLAKLAVASAREHGVEAAAAGLAAHLSAVRAHAYAPRVIADERGAREILLAPLAPLPAGWTETVYENVAELARTVLVEQVRAGDAAARRAAVAKALADMRRREEERLRHTRENLARCNEADTCEKFGNLLKGQLALIQPYRDSVEVVDWYAEGNPKVRIPLKKNLAPKQNAERYFLKAKKLRGSVRQLEQRLAEHDDNLAELAELEAELGRVEAREDLERLEAHVRAIGRASGGKPRTESAGGPLQFVSTAGYRILVGRNARENDVLTRKLAKAHDMWLHAKGMAGAHVVVKLRDRNEECPPETLEEAAQLAAWYSKARYSTNVEVSIMRAGEVRKAPGAAPGQVLIEKSRTMRVRPRLARPI